MFADMSTSAVLRRPFPEIRFKLNWKITTIFLLLALNLRTFQYFPGGRPLEEFWFLLMAASFFLVYPLFKIHSDWRFSKLELYLLAVMLIAILLPATSAQRAFGQPLIYGVLARRAGILLTTWLLFLNAWRRRWITAAQVQTALLANVWVVAVLFGAMRLLLNPLTFPNAPPGFTTGAGTEAVAFTAPGHILPFGVLYYALRGIRQRSGRDYFLAALIFVINTGSSWRTLSACLAATLLLFLARWRPLNEVVGALLRLLVVLAIVTGLMQVLAPNLLGDIVTHFTDAVQVAVGQGPGEDSSANARYYEVTFALPYVREHPITGVGQLSEQWQSGPAAVLGLTFFDNDIGLLGILYSYGALGLLVCALQYVFALRAAREVPRTVHTPLLDATKGYLIYTALSSISTGFFVYSIETSTFFVMLLVLLADDFQKGLLDGAGTEEGYGQ